MLNDKGCRVSASEVKDALDLLAHVDINDSELVFDVLVAALAKDESCYVALEESVMDIRNMLKEASEGE